MINLPYLDNEALRETADLEAANRTVSAPLRFGVEQPLDEINILKSGMESEV